MGLNQRFRDVVYQINPSEITATIIECVRTNDPKLVELAEEVYSHLTPKHWQIEWYLPVWLGTKYKLPESTIQSLVLGNILGLGAIRTWDNVRDNEVVHAYQSNKLADILWREMFVVYSQHFAETHPFWDEVDELMLEWRHPRPEVLNDRASPLKAEAIAICTIANRRDELPTILSTLEHSINAWVMLDDAEDWMKDFKDGRHNIMAEAFASGTVEDYFLRLDGELVQAINGAVVLRIDLADYLINVHEQLYPYAKEYIRTFNEFSKKIEIEFA